MFFSKIFDNFDDDLQKKFVSCSPKQSIKIGVFCLLEVEIRLYSKSVSDVQQWELILTGLDGKKLS